MHTTSFIRLYQYHDFSAIGFYKLGGDPEKTDRIFKCLFPIQIIPYRQAPIHYIQDNTFTII